MTRKRPPRKLTASSYAQWRRMWLTRAEQIHRAQFPEPAGEGWTPYPREVPDNPSPALPGLELEIFESKVRSVLTELELTATEDREHYRSEAFQEVAQHKIIKAVKKLEEALV